MIHKDQQLKEISFPLGGIGTGCIGLAGEGKGIHRVTMFNHAATPEESAIRFLAGRKF